MSEEVKSLVATVQQQQEQIVSLLNTIKAMPWVSNPVAVNVVPAQPAAAEIRAEKIQRLAVCMRKSNRVKPFKFDSDILVFLKRFQEELISLKSITGIDFQLSKEEYIPIFRASLDFAVLDRLEQRFKRDDQNIITWDAVTINDLHKVMKEEFGQKQTDVAEVLGQFGQSRLVKSPDKSVKDHFFEWESAIPEIMKPTNDQERKDFVDLVHRSMYYISLEDTYLQKALSDLKVAKPSLQAYFEEAVAAESRRKCYNDINSSSSKLESSKDVTISKWKPNWDPSFRKQKDAKPQASVNSTDKSKKKNDQNSDSKTKQASDTKTQQNPRNQVQNKRSFVVIVGNLIM